MGEAHRRRNPDEPGSIPLDPETALRGLMQGDPKSSPSETPRSFFAERHFDINFSDGDGFVCTDLQSTRSDVALPRHGRGSDEASAAARAVERWQQEQGE